MCAATLPFWITAPCRAGQRAGYLLEPAFRRCQAAGVPGGTPERELLPGRKMVRVAFNGTQTTDKPLVASLAIECGALVSIVAADTRVVNGQTLGSMAAGLPEGEGAAKALDYIKNYPGITYEEVGSNG